MRRSIFFPLWFFVLFLPLARAEKPEERLTVKLPPVVIVGEETLRAETLSRVPLPTLVVPLRRETPPVEVVELGREAEKVMERPSPAVRSPGCAYATGIGASVARVIQGIEALYKRGLYLYVKGDKEGARRAFEKILRDYPKSLYASMALYWLGEMALEEGRGEEALGHFRRLWRQYPGSPYEDYALQSGGWLLMKMGRYEEALKVLKRLPEAVPRSPLRENARLLKAYILVLQGAHDRAQALLDEALTEGKRFRAEALYLYALSLFASGRHEEASQVIGRFLGDYPRHPLREGGLYIAGWARWATDDLEGARKAFGAYLSDHPSGRWAGPVRWGLVKVLLGLGREAEAKEVLKSLLSPEPSPWGGEGLYDLARFLVSKGRDEEALEALRRVVEGWKEGGLLQRAHLLMGEILSRRGDYGAAAEAFGEAVQGGGELALYALLNQGLALYHGGKASEAVGVWKGLWDMLPEGHPLRERVLFSLVLGHLAVDEPNLALEALRGLPPSSEVYRQGLLALGWYHFQHAQWEEAARWGLRAGGPQGEFLRGLALFNSKRYKEALEVFRLLEGATGLQEELLRSALYYRGLCHYKLEEFAEAAQAFKVLISRWPSSPVVPEALYWWGWSLLRLGRWEEAEGLFLRVAKGFPKHPLAPKAWVKVGDCRYNRGEYDRAALAYLRVKRDYPNSDALPDAYWGIVLSYYGAGKEDRFRLWAEELMRALGRHPLSVNVLLLLGSYYEAKGRGEEAEGCYRRAVREFPEVAGVEEARLRLAHLLREKGRTSEALSVLKEVRRLPHRWKSLLEMASLCMETDRLQEARLYLWEVLGRGSEELAFRAAMEAARGLGQGAKEFLEAFLERFPRSRRAFEVLLKLGELGEKGGRHEEALRWFRLAAQRAPTEGLKARCELRMASLLLKMGHRDEALEQAMRVLYLYPEEKEAGALGMLQAAEIYRARGDKEGARQACKRALELSQSEEVLKKAKEICGAAGSGVRRSNAR